MVLLTSMGFGTAAILASQQLPIGPIAIDLNYWGQIILWAAAMSAALYGLWLQWLKPIVRWFQHQGVVHERMATTQERMSGDVRAIRTEQRALAQRVDIIERVIFPPLAGGSEESPPEDFMLTDEEMQRVWNRIRGGLGNSESRS